MKEIAARIEFVKTTEPRFRAKTMLNRSRFDVITLGIPEAVCFDRRRPRDRYLQLPSSRCTVFVFSALDR